MIGSKHIVKHLFDTAKRLFVMIIVLLVRRFCISGENKKRFVVYKEQNIAV